MQNIKRKNRINNLEIYDCNRDRAGNEILASRKGF